MRRKHQTQRQHRLRVGRVATGPRCMVARDPLGGSVMPALSLSAHEQIMPSIIGRYVGDQRNRISREDRPRVRWVDSEAHFVGAGHRRGDHQRTTARWIGFVGLAAAIPAGVGPTASQIGHHAWAPIKCPVNDTENIRVCQRGPQLGHGHKASRIADGTRANVVYRAGGRFRSETPSRMKPSTRTLC